MFSIFIMNTAQAYGQRLRPVQETGIEKTESLLSVQQTSIGHSMDVMINSSRLVMDNRNSSVGSTENIFGRLTQRLVFEFLGGHFRMEELPCLGDLVDGNDEFHRITPSPTFSKSSQFKLLDATGNLHLSSILFIDSDFNPRIEDYLCESVLLNSFDTSSTTFISFLEHFESKLTSQSADHSIEDIKFNDQLSDCVWNYNEKILDTPGGLVGLEDGSSSGEYEEIEVSRGQCSFWLHVSVTPKVSDPCNTQLLDTHSPTVVDSSSFDVSNHEELLEIYGLNNLGQYTDVDYTCASPTWPGKVDAARKEAIRIHLTDLASNEDPLSSFYDENSKNSVSSTHLEQIKCASNTCSSLCCTEDDSSQGHPCSDEFENSIDELILGTPEKSLIYAIHDPNSLNEYLYGNLTTPMSLSSEQQDENLDTFDYPSLLGDSDTVKKRNDSSSFYESCYSDYCGDVASSSDKCNVELLDSDNICKNPSAFPFDFNDDYEFLETYGLNEQDQYTDDFICKSPTWPGKA